MLSPSGTLRIHFLLPNWLLPCDKSKSLGDMPGLCSAFIWVQRACSPWVYTLDDFPWAAMPIYHQVSASSLLNVVVEYAGALWILSINPLSGICKYFLPFYGLPFHLWIVPLEGLPSGKESTCQRRRHKRHGFNPWVGKVPGNRKWQLVPVFLPGNSMDRGTWWAIVHGVAMSWTQLNEWAHTHTHENVTQCPIYKVFMRIHRHVRKTHSKDCCKV